MRKPILWAMILLGICCLAVPNANAQQTYEYSTIVYDDSIGAVYGNSVTEIDYNSDYYYDAYVESYLYENGILVDSNYAESATGTASALTAAWANPDAEYTETGYHDLYVRFGNEERYPEGCMPCDGCNTDCYWDNWYYYDAYGFSFVNTGNYGPWFDLLGEGPPTYIENNQEEYLGETSASLTTAPIPDHLQITNDVTQTVQPCDELERNIFFTVVDYNDHAVGNTDVRESDFNGVSTCDNEAPDFTDECGTAPGGNYGDSLNAGCPNNGDSHCGFHDTNEQHLWCSSHGLVPIAAFDYDVHHDVIVVSGHSGQLPLHWYVRADKSIKAK